MKKSIRFLLSALLLHCVDGQLLSQTYMDEIADAIELKVHSLYNGQFTVNIVVVMDSSLNKAAFPNAGPKEDPYGTLKGCVLFTAQPIERYYSSRAFVGIFKNNQILWHSDTVISIENSYQHDIVATTDLNNDGKVDIITSWLYGMTMNLERLWIFSWDGQNGTVINDYDSENLSVIKSYEGLFLLVDINADGIFEIQGVEDPYSEPEKIVTYAWNGSVYTNWPNSPQPLPSGYLPKNRLEVEVKARVVKDGSSFVFHYVLDNKATSIQKVDAFLLPQCTDSIRGKAVPRNWNFGLLRKQLFGWRDDRISPRPIPKGGIEPDFACESTALPRLMPFYVQGENFWWGQPSVDRETLEFPEEAWYQDIINNSFRGLTVGPGNSPFPLVPLDFLDTLSSYTTQSRSLGWIKDQPTADKYLGYFSTARAKLVQRDSGGVRTVLVQVLHDVDIDSTANLTSEAYALLKFNTEYLVDALPQTPAAPLLAVKLVSSTGINLTGGSLQYYDGGWKDATNNNDGTFSIDTKLKTISLRMTYAYGSQTKSNVAVGADMVVFQTVNAQVKLQNRQGALMDTGAVQYYAGAWRSFGTTTNGVATKELLPNNYSFRMTYAYASKDKQQDIAANPTVVFETVNAAVQLQNSQGSLIDGGTVQYYSGAWREFGVTTNGVATKELLPSNYSFRITYAYASKDKQQDIGANSTVVFQTVSAVVQLQNSQGGLIDQGTVQYYSGAWRSFGTTANGAATKELLPNNYSFRMTYEFVSNDKAHDLSTSSTVSFSTVLCRVRVKDAQNQPVDGAQASYYAGAWRPIGGTVNGEVTKELLPANLTFRIRYGATQQDEAQNLSTNTVVEFSVQ